MRRKVRVRWNGTFSLRFSTLTNMQAYMFLKKTCSPYSFYPHFIRTWSQCFGRDGSFASIKWLISDEQLCLTFSRTHTCVRAKRAYSWRDEALQTPEALETRYGCNYYWTVSESLGDEKWHLTKDSQHWLTARCITPQKSFLTPSQVRWKTS